MGEQAKNLTTSGIIGGAYMLQTLAKIGRGDLALEIATATAKPSWGYMVLQGPGTIWETWDDSSNSHNHPALCASIGEYLYELAGVTHEAALNGRRLIFQLDAMTASKVRSARVAVVGPAGKAEFDWKLLADGKAFVANVSVPHGEMNDVSL